MPVRIPEIQPHGVQITGLVGVRGKAEFGSHGRLFFAGLFLFFLEIEGLVNKLDGFVVGTRSVHDSSR